MRSTVTVNNRDILFIISFGVNRFQDAEKDVQHVQGSGFYPHPHPPLVSTCSAGSDSYHHHVRLRHEPSTSSGVSSQHQDDQNQFDDLTRRSFREYFLHAVPLVVHPIIILRLLCHKMFGSMLRRKEAFSAQNLSPPTMSGLDNDSCPPRTQTTETTDSKDKEAGAGTPTIKRRKTNLHVQIAMPTDDEEEQIRYIRRRTRRAGSMDKHLLRLSSMRKRMGSATMSLAIKAIGDSLMTPLDLNISPPPKATDLEVNDPDYKKRNIFRFPSIKKGFMSKSHGYIAGIGDSFESAMHSSVKSSMQSLGKNNDQESDLKEFQKELINLPIYEVDTHRMDQSTSPLISRSNSVPEHLAHIHEMGLDNLSSFTLRGSQRRRAYHVKTETVPLMHRSSDGYEVRQELKKERGGALTMPPTTICEPVQALDTWNNNTSSSQQQEEKNMSTSISAETVSSTPLSLHLTLPVPNHNGVQSQTTTGDTIIVHFAAATPCSESPPSNSFPVMLPPPENSLPSRDLSQLETCESVHLETPPLILPKAHGASHRGNTCAGDLHTSAGSQSRPTQLLAVSSSVPASVESSHASLPMLSPGGLSMQSDPRSPGNFSLHMPSFSGKEIPLHHQAIMKVIETWVDVSSMDLEVSDVMRKEVKDFLTRMASLGPERRMWSQKIQSKLHLEVLAVCQFITYFRRKSYCFSFSELYYMLILDLSQISTKFEY